MDWNAIPQGSIAGSFSVAEGWENFGPKFIGHPGTLVEGRDLVANDDAICFYLDLFAIEPGEE